MGLTAFTNQASRDRRVPGSCRWRGLAALTSTQMCGGSLLPIVSDVHPFLPKPGHDKYLSDHTNTLALGHTLGLAQSRGCRATRDRPGRVYEPDDSAALLIEHGLTVRSRT